MLNTNSFAKALKSLETVLRKPKDDIIRDSAIQRFEYTYELATKTLKRFLEVSEPAKPVVDELSFKDLVRLAAEKGCITDPEAWFAYREARNITSHAYDEKKAEMIYGLLPAFVRDAQALLAALVSKSAGL